jgi:hypothetical protein
MPDMMKEITNGIIQGIPSVAQAMNGLAQNMVPTTQNMGNMSNTVNINVYGAQGQNVNELADIIQDRINANVYRNGAVFA